MKNFISKLGEGNLAVAYRLPWEAVTAVLLISVPWWENFMDANCSKLHQFAENMKRVNSFDLFILVIHHLPFNMLSLCLLGVPSGSGQSLHLCQFMEDRLDISLLISISQWRR